MFIKEMVLQKFLEIIIKYLLFLCMEKNYPFQKMKSDLDIELLDETEDKEYLNILDEELNIIFDKIKPELFFIYQELTF